MIALQSIDAVFAKAYEDALKHGSGLYETRMFDQIMQAKHVPHSDVFRFRYISGKSHAHSRKIWRERERRRMHWTVSTVVEMPKISDHETEVCSQLMAGMAARINREIELACWGALL